MVPQIAVLPIPSQIAEKGIGYGSLQKKGQKGESPTGLGSSSIPVPSIPGRESRNTPASRAGLSKRLADLTFAQKMLEWEKKKHLGLETKREFVFRELAEWYLGLPRVQAKRSCAMDVSRMAVLVG